MTLQTGPFLGLQMWAFDGALTGVLIAEGTVLTLTLPRGRTGTIIVGTGAALSQPVPFALVTTSQR